MLTHLKTPPAPPPRVVVMGARGFVGGAVDRHLRSRGIATLALSRPDVDLLQPGADERLAALLRPEDALVFVSAIAPCRDVGGLIRNLTMVQAVLGALGRSPVAHLVNIGSDAVYAQEAQRVDARTPVAPDSMHGMMHAARELALRTSTRIPLATLRPSLLYGATDPHNGYGPNRFRRLAAEGKDIPLFGGGEEKRDHVLVDDVARLVELCLIHRSAGTLDAVTGRSVSFRDVAEMIVGRGKPVAIVPSPRQNPILHREFDVTDRKAAFPDFTPTALEAGLARVHQETTGGIRG